MALHTTASVPQAVVDHDNLTRRASAESIREGHQNANLEGLADDSGQNGKLQNIPFNKESQLSRVSRHPDMATQEARLKSFAAWAHADLCAPDGLADAGFYYAGEANNIRCFDCGILVKITSKSDADPWKEHALWTDDCPFLLQRQVGSGVFSGTTSGALKTRDPKQTVKRQHGAQKITQPEQPSSKQGVMEASTSTENHIVSTPPAPPKHTALEQDQGGKNGAALTKSGKCAVDALDMKPVTTDQHARSIADPRPIADNQHAEATAFLASTEKLQITGKATVAAVTSDNQFTGDALVSASSALGKIAGAEPAVSSLAANVQHFEESTEETPVANVHNATEVVPVLMACEEEEESHMQIDEPVAKSPIAVPIATDLHAEEWRREGGGEIRAQNTPEQPSSKQGIVEASTSTEYHPVSTPPAPAQYKILTTACNQEEGDINGANDQGTALTPSGKSAVDAPDMKPVATVQHASSTAVPRLTADDQYAEMTTVPASTEGRWRTGKATVAAVTSDDQFTGDALVSASSALGKIAGAVSSLAANIQHFEESTEETPVANVHNATEVVPVLMACEEEEGESHMQSDEPVAKPPIAVVPIASDLHAEEVTEDTSTQDDQHVGVNRSSTAATFDHSSKDAIDENAEDVLPQANKSVLDFHAKGSTADAQHIEAAAVPKSVESSEPTNDQRMGSAPTAKKQHAQESLIPASASIQQGSMTTAPVPQTFDPTVESTSKAERTASHKCQPASQKQRDQAAENTFQYVLSEEGLLRRELPPIEESEESGIHYLSSDGQASKMQGLEKDGKGQETTKSQALEFDSERLMPAAQQVPCHDRKLPEGSHDLQQPNMQHFHDRQHQEIYMSQEQVCQQQPAPAPAEAIGHSRQHLKASGSNFLESHAQQADPLPPRDCHVRQHPETITSRVQESHIQQQETSTTQSVDHCTQQNVPWKTCSGQDLCHDTQQEEPSTGQANCSEHWRENSMSQASGTDWCHRDSSSKHEETFTTENPDHNGYRQRDETSPPLVLGSDTSLEQAHATYHDRRLKPCTAQVLESRQQEKGSSSQHTLNPSRHSQEAARAQPFGSMQRDTTSSQNYNAPSHPQALGCAAHSCEYQQKRNNDAVPENWREDNHSACQAEDGGGAAGGGGDYDNASGSDAGDGETESSSDDDETEGPRGIYSDVEIDLRERTLLCLHCRCEEKQVQLPCSHRNLCYMCFFCPNFWRQHLRDGPPRCLLCSERFTDIRDFQVLCLALAFNHRRPRTPNCGCAFRRG